MAPARLLDRNVRPKGMSREEVEGAEEASDPDFPISGASEDESRSDASSVSSDEEDVASKRSDETESALEGEEVEQQLGNVSFAALLQAQDSLSKKRKRGSDSTPDQDAKLEAVRARLRELRSRNESQKRATGDPSSRNRATGDVRATISSNGRSREPESEHDHAEDDSDSAPSEEEAPSKARTSKHAPTSQSSRHQVTRKRNVIDVPKRVIRDPRFDALHQTSSHPGNNEKAYSFLLDYQKAEIAELKAAVKATRNEDDKERLRRNLVSMENRIKSKEAKEREQEVVRQHRKEEKEKVEHGKKPFFLKRKDVKGQALVKKYEGMKGKEREKLVERRIRKEGQREKKRMPQARRARD